MIITRDKRFYRLLFSIALPIAVQNLITFMVSMVDTLMVGALGEIQLSAVSIANNLFFVLTILMFGLAGGSNIMISQYWGKGNVKTIHKILAIMYRVCLLITGIFIFIALFLPKYFMGIFTTDKAVIDFGASYLRIVCIGYLFYSITNCTIMMLRSVKTVSISIIVYTASLVVNSILNWIFIFGNLGAPELGIRGAAIATICARITEFSIVLVFMFIYERKIGLKIEHLLKLDKEILKDYVGLCTPVLCNELLWAIGASMISVIVGRMGTEVVAANSINGVAHQFVTVFIFGMSNATAVIIGNTIGEGKKEKAKEYAYSIGIFSVVMGCISGLMILLIKPFVVNFYNVSYSTKLIAMEIMTVTSGIIVFQSLASNFMMGVLRGGGDAKFVLINDLIFMWLVAIPGGFFVAFVLELPVALVFLVIKCDEILKSLTSVYRVISGKWVNDVTKDYEFEEVKC
ncbi:MATE family efflux transporter [Clostridium perfringens]|uniref:MATE efflux family protein n=1 Tax=Clostridium perfringens (strain SM101 / Type A) TaxID=289380 RepID=Q0SUN4_CLOPS|nr:MATE family efflux transporter [Clostridium perfringens]ABG85997.1 MATE efflux family protein [Clostridium perfringens SM101]EJT5916784.1 MATE family efflux transporter [Clostridium perfringens]EJT5924469.1 MATE family efflux transporter [Clostridium perfringens]EJT6135455.1 MATE family efflux transporter [Clostridium perfringens]MBP2860818.1 MATE family efflux transporter [Clostridium perfringens]